MIRVRGDLPQSSPPQNAIFPYTPTVTFRKNYKRSKNQLVKYFFSRVRYSLEKYVKCLQNFLAKYLYEIIDRIKLISTFAL